MRGAQTPLITPGTGKSHLLVALGHAAVAAGHRVRYFTAAELVETLYRGLADNSVGRVIDLLLRHDLIICDEVGFAPLDDTGATSSSLPATAIAALGLEHVGTSATQDIGGPRHSSKYALPALSIGPWVVRGVEVSEYPGDSGLLGHDVLRHFVFVLDGPGEKLWITFDPGR